MNNEAANDLDGHVSEDDVFALNSNSFDRRESSHGNGTVPFFLPKTLIDNLPIPSIIIDKNKNIFTSEALSPDFSGIIKNIDGKMVFEDRNVRERFLNFVRKIEEINPIIFSIRDVFSKFENGHFTKIVTFKSMTDISGRHNILMSVLTLEYERKLSPAVLQDLFGFTPAEGRVAVLLANGKSVIECAEELGIRISTVREKLSNLFAKTRTSRQSELVSMLSRLELLG